MPAAVHGERDRVSGIHHYASVARDGTIVEFWMVGYDEHAVGPTQRVLCGLDRLKSSPSHSEGRHVIPTLKERLGDDDDVPGRQRDVRVRLGVPLDRIDVHTQPYLLVGFASSIPTSSSIPSVNRVLPNEGDPRWRGKLREAPGNGDQLHDRQRLGASVGAGLGDLAHDEDRVLHVAPFGNDNGVFIPDHQVLGEIPILDEPPEVHWRSEEHTSELQSLAYLVCRLLLEKKKNT